MVANWEPSRNGQCPNCRKKDTASHLNLCGDAERTRLLNTMADKLGTWLSINHAHPELEYWIPKYIKLRGIRQVSDFTGLSADMKQVAASQDLIPWSSFMEGKISTEILTLQNTVLGCSPSKLTIASWGKQLISQILQISHAQWVFRNVSLHDKAAGYLQKLERRKVLQEIDRLAGTDPSNIPASSQYLLEMDFSSSQSATLEEQSYWLFAMRAAMIAGQRVSRRRAATSSNTRQRRAQRQIQTSTNTTGTPTHNITTNQLSHAPSSRMRQRSITSSTRTRTELAGAHETLRSIHRDWASNPRTTSKRPHPSSIFLTRNDTKRRRPD